MRLSLLAIAMASTLLMTACGDKNAAGDKATGDKATATSTTGASTSKPATGEAKMEGITGAGASFPQPIYAKWATDYKAANGTQINYQSIGSSGGIKQIQANTVDFGASDAPMKPEELDKDGLIQFPTVIGGVVPVVNLEGIKPGELKLDGPTLAEIYLGKITKWNDPKIAGLNAGLKLPDAPINTVFRADGSGTTYNFTNYLGAVSPDWKAGPGVDKSVKWPTEATGTGAGGKGNEGVASMVKATANSIGYVEYAYAKQNNMTHTQLKNKAGNFVQPSAESFAAAGDADWKAAKGFYLTITDQPAAQAWPISAATFIIVHKQPKNPENVKGALQFFDWAYKSGDDAAKSLDFVPFSEATKNLIRASWSQVVGADGKPLYVPTMGAETGKATATATATDSKTEKKVEGDKAVSSTTTTTTTKTETVASAPAKS